VAGERSKVPRTRLAQVSAIVCLSKSFKSRRRTRGFTVLVLGCNLASSLWSCYGGPWTRNSRERSLNVREILYIRNMDTCFQRVHAASVLPRQQLLRLDLCCGTVPPEQGFSRSCCNYARLIGSVNAQKLLRHVRSSSNGSTSLE
jgi:hypothetical protein